MRGGEGNRHLTVLKKPVPLLCAPAGFRTAALINAALSPFLLVFLLLYFFMRNAEHFYHHPGTFLLPSLSSSTPIQCAPSVILQGVETLLSLVRRKNSDVLLL